MLVHLKSAEMFWNGQHPTDDVIYTMTNANSLLQINAFPKRKLNFWRAIHGLEATIQCQNFTPRVLQQQDLVICLQINKESYVKTTAQVTMTITV